MSNNKSAPQRVRRNASPGSSSSSTPKQVPMRAILPVALMRQQQGGGGGGCGPSNSPTMTWPCDGAKSKSGSSGSSSRKSPERRSPGSPSFKAEKSKPVNLKSSSSSSVIRRTASLDAIYLKGQWPRDGFRTYCGTLLVDKSTQTTEEWTEVGDKRKSPYGRSSSVGNADPIQYIRTCLQRNKEGNRQGASNGQRYSPIHGDHSAVPSLVTGQQQGYQQSHVVSRPVTIPNIPKPLMPRMRNSVEGLNQEIERLVLKGISGNDDDTEREPTPDGHRAPIADLFKATHRTVDTQTPSNSGNGGGGGDESSHSSGQESRCHSMSPPIPIIIGVMDSPCSSQNDDNQAFEQSKTIKEINKSPSPEPEQKYCCSPHNKFLAREPPDGCERVKIIEDPRNVPLLPDPLKPRDSFILQPSQGSAFCPLRRSRLHQTTEFVLKPVTQANQAATIEGQ